MLELRNLSIARKIQLLVGISILGILAVGGAALWITARLTSATSDVGRTQLPAVHRMTLCDMMHDGMLACVYRALLVSESTDPVAMEAASEETRQFAANFREYFAALDELDVVPETRAAIETARPDVEAYIAGAERLVELCAASRRDEAVAAMADVQVLYDTLEVDLGELGERIEHDAERAVDQAESLASFASSANLGMVALTSVLTLMIASGIARGIVRPLDAAVVALESSDITGLAAVERSDEIGRVAKAVVATVRRMEESATELAAQKRTIEANAEAMQASARTAEENAERAEQLAREAARVAAMVENSPACMMYADDTMTVRHVNPAAKAELARLGGRWDAEALTGKPLADFYRHPRGNREFFAKDSNLPFRTQTALEKDVVEISCSAIHDPSKARTGTLITWEIVTERIAQERRAAASAAEAARVASMVENAAGCMMYADRNLVLRYLNPAAKELLPRLRLDPEHLIGSPIDTFWRHPEGSTRFFAEQQHLPWSQTVQFEAETVQLAASGIQDQSGEMIGVMFSWEVVTERLAAEARARELQERELARAQEIQSKVERMLVAVDAASKGDLTARIEVSGDDAIGRMASALTRLFADLRASLSRIHENTEQLARASETLIGVGRRMNDEAEQTSTQVHVVADAASKASVSMRTVSESTYGMTQSIGEIATSASSAAKVARTAVASAEETNKTVSELDRSSEEIGKILKTITAIAQQTNLLALNATIEAARAGEMGRGFAVVANEVKELAKETAKATTDISAKVEAIQSGSRGAVEAISKIGAIIKEIDGLQTTIAAAVEQQTAATRDITSNLDQATRSSAAITENMGHVAGAARTTSEGAANSLEVAGEVAKRAEELRMAISRFRC